MSRKAPDEDECPHILIVEGHSDLLFYAAFLHHLGRLSGVFLKEFKGKSNVLKRELLESYLTPKRLAEKASIGVVLDADENPAGTAKSLASHLKAITGRDVMEGRWQEEEGFARLGFFVAPDTQTQGEIETLVWNALPSSGAFPSMKAAVSTYLGGMETLGWTAHSPDKARIGAFLAAAYDEDPRLGPGARQNLFDFGAPGFARLRAFLEVLPRQPESATP